MERVHHNQKLSQVSIGTFTMYTIEDWTNI